MSVYLNWNKTANGLLCISVMTFALSFVLQNLQLINNLTILPIGLPLLLILGILITRHLYKVFKYYCFLNRNNNISNILIHASLYSIVTICVLSIPVSISISDFDKTFEPSIIVKIIPNSIDNVISTKNKYPEINGATKDEQSYIMTILNNSKLDVRNQITSVNVVSEQNIENICNGIVIGCAFNDGRIYIVPLSFWNTPHLIYVESGAGYIRCSSFAWTLNHEIGHIKGFMVGDESETFAENYAYDHTTVNLVYEPEPKC